MYIPRLLIQQIQPPWKAKIKQNRKPILTKWEKIGNATLKASIPWNSDSEKNWRGVLIGHRSCYITRWQKSLSAVLINVLVTIMFKSIADSKLMFLKYGAIIIDTIQIFF